MTNFYYFSVDDKSGLPRNSNSKYTLGLKMFGPGGLFQRAGMREGGLPLPPA